MTPHLDPEFAAPSEWAALYREHGLQVVPAYMPRPHQPEFQWKRPMLAGWTHFQKELTVDKTFGDWYDPMVGRFRAHQNMGLITGSCSDNVFVIDLDTHANPQAKLWWQAQLEVNNYGRLPDTWAQITGGGGLQVFFRAPRDWVAPTNRTPIGVDIRGQGGFAMLPPSLHSSGKCYHWTDGAAPWEADLAKSPQWLLDAIDALVEQYGGHKPELEEGHQRTPNPSQDHDWFGKRVDGREDDMTRRVWAGVMAMKRAGDEPGSPKEREHFEAALMPYLRETRTRLKGVDNVEGLEREGRGPSLFLAKWQRAMRKWGTEAFEREAAKPPPKKSEIISGTGTGTERIISGTISGTGTGSEQSPSPIPIRPAFPIDGQAIERRKWVIRGLLIRSHLSLLVAPAGSGKSLLTLQLGIALAAGMSWGGFTIKKKHRVLVINAEDDIEEMRRRLWAAAHTMGVAQEDIAESLFLAEQPEQIVIAKTIGREVVRQPLLKDLVATIEAHEIDAVIVDPFAETFEGDENSNSEVKWAGIAWREVARLTEAALLLVHHTKKYANGMAGDADASRGGGALIGTARVVSTLFAMTEDEAKLMGIDPEERGTFVRYDDAKANLSLVTKVARWFRKESVSLPNGSIAEPADDVGVLVPWKPPGLFEGLSNATIIDTLDVIDRGLIDAESGRPTGAFYTHHANSANKSRWAGTPIMARLQCDENKAKAIVKTWLASGLLVEDSYNDGKQDRACVRVDHTKKPGMEG